MSLTQCFIDGAPVPADETYDNLDPATGALLGAVARGGPAEVDRAVTAAASRAAEWAAAPPERRARVLTRLGSLVRRDHEELARVECEDTGKPLAQARTDVAVCARYLDFYGHAADTYYGLTIPLEEGLHVYTRREPFGVVGHVLAWNYPLQLLARGIGPALCTGNTVVVKPADETPRTAVMIAGLAAEAGLPPGTLNVVTGLGPEAGAALAAHPDVAHVGFVGSPATGSAIAHAAAERLVPTLLELGGKSPQVVFPDADVETAAEHATRAIVQNAGQTCSAGSRLLVHRAVHDELVELVLARFAATSIGPGLEDPDLGPLISPRQRERVQALVATDHGGTVLAGGAVPREERLAAGSYYSPTLIDGVDPRATIAREEVFGPVLVTHTFDDEDEAVALANGTDYGLLAAVWTRDLSRAHRLAARIEAGQVFVNTYGAGGGVELPFGGFKKSGYGREKGHEAMDNYTRTKTVVVRL